MAKKDENIFTKSAQKREAEQVSIKKSVGVAETSNAERTTVNISVAKEVKVGMKVYAAQHGTSVSGLIEKWYYENCQEA